MLLHLEKAIRIPRLPTTWSNLAAAQGRNGQMALAKLSLAEEALLEGFARALKNALFARKTYTDLLLINER